MARNVSLLSTFAILIAVLAAAMTLKTGDSNAGGYLQAVRPEAAPTAAPANTEYIERLHEDAQKGGASVLSVGDSYDDFASIAQAGDGTIYAAYASYYNGHDQIRIHQLRPDGRWSTYTYVPTARGFADVWMPQLATDSQNRLWVIWCEQTYEQPGGTGNWDLYARYLDGDSWGPLVRLTDDPKPDINPHVVNDKDHNIHVVWQAHPQNNGDIRYRRFDGKEWNPTVDVTSDPESDWYPSVAVSDEGRVWIAFDSYRNGDYDVFLTGIRGDGKLRRVYPIATSSYYEANASVACTPDGRIWVSWEQGGHNWGKDQGYWLRKSNRDDGTALGSTRTVKVACYYDREVWAAPDVTESVGRGRRSSPEPSGSAILATGPDGRLWLRYRQMVKGSRDGRPTKQKGWVEQITYLSRDGWEREAELPASAGRISVFSRILPVADGSLYAAYSSDGRAVDNFHRPIQDTALVAHIETPRGRPDIPQLRRYEQPEPPAGVPAWNSSQEAKQVDDIRRKRATIDGQRTRIVRGDLHRHTELSWDVGPGGDGSFLDYYRYMIDVAAMDFGGMTDHQGGGHYAYWWWLIEKSCDMYYLQPRFVPLYGYERSARFPDGHRNVFHAYRGVPVFPFQEKLGQVGHFPGTGSRTLVENDTKLLYDYLRNTGGVSIPHTSGTSTMGTDWRDNDSVVEPVVEIYQGARNSYEALGAPRVHSQDEAPDKAPGGFQEAGMVWNAYKKGYRLGTIASSDHGSTHISYALVYTPKNDRREIIDAIRQRHTYGATDNIIVEFQANGSHFMGDEFYSRERPSLEMKVTGTGRIAQLDLVRNNRYLLSEKQNSDTIDRKFVDMDPVQGTNLYYFRIVQDDGQVAWSSPIWVNYRAR